MFLGHLAVGLAGKRVAPAASLGTWFLSVQLVDLVWPLCLLAGIEHVRIVPGITAFTPLDFYDYPITHSLVAGVGWATAMAGCRLAVRRGAVAALLLGAGVLSHWVLDAVSHRPDMPVLPHGPYVGLGLWNSVAATLTVELLLFAGGLVLYARSRPDGLSRRCQVFVAFLLIVYFAAAFGPPPPDVRTLAWSAMAAWLLVPLAWWVDRDRAPKAR